MTPARVDAGDTPAPATGNPFADLKAMLERKQKG